MSNTQKFSRSRGRSTSKYPANGTEESLARSRLSAASPWRLFQVVGAKNQPFHSSTVILSLCRRSSHRIIFFTEIFYCQFLIIESVSHIYIYYRKSSFCSARITDYIRIVEFGCQPFFYRDSSDRHRFRFSEFFLASLTLLHGFLTLP